MTLLIIENDSLRGGEPQRIAIDLPPHVMPAGDNVEVLRNGKPLPRAQWVLYEVTHKRIQWAEQGGEVYWRQGTDSLVIRPRSHPFS